MSSLIGILALTLLVILVASELFTNALEHLGEELKISEGVTGSLFAAIGTALPETMVPLIALLAGTKDLAVNEEIGVGAILGAPLMLATLSTSLMAAVAIKVRGLNGYVAPERSGFLRDLNFFLVAFCIAAAAMYVPQGTWRHVLSVTLVLIYGLYVSLTLRASEKLVETGHGTESDEKIFISYLGFKKNHFTIFLQLAFGLILLIAGAKGFIYGVEGVSSAVGISPLLLSLVVIPIATELPEKVNSILWIRKGKDTLAFGNITGAMVFQGTLLPAIGIMLTPWEPRTEVIFGIFITLLAVAWIRFQARNAKLPLWTLLLSGILYFIFLGLSLAGW